MEKSTTLSKKKRNEWKCFKANLKTILMHNYLYSKGQKSFTMGVNEYSDMDHEEFKGVMNGCLLPRNYTLAPSEHSTYMLPNVPFTIPETVDWRDQGYVTPIKNQSNCGACWAFSATGSLEGQMFRKSGSLPSLSEQNLVDCSKEWGNDGCNGGRMENAFRYIRDNKGIDTEKSYPYEAKDDECRFEKANVGGEDHGLVELGFSGDENILMAAVAINGPISVAIDASHASFQGYSGDVYDEPDCSSSQLDHAVLVIGYGSLDGKDYWLVKNSWGESWGKDGYIYMSRNKDNQCGIATHALFPIV